MADKQKMTPKEFATSLEAYVTIVMGAGSLGSVLTSEDLDQIRNAGSMEEALRVANRTGLDLHGLPFYVEATKSLEGPHDFQRGRSDPLPPPTPEQQQISAYQQQIADQRAAMEQMMEEGEGPPLPNLLFPTDLLPYSMPEQINHIQMVTSDDYSPWRATSEDRRGFQGQGMTRPEMERFVEMNVPIATGTVGNQGGLRESQQQAAYWREQFGSVGAYASGDELAVWSSLPATERARLEEKFVQAGWLPVEGDTIGFSPGAFDLPQLVALRQAMAIGTYFGQGYEFGANAGVRAKKYNDALERARNAAIWSGSGRVRAPFSVPASLREIPDYESISQEVTNLFRQRLGRDPEDYEVGVLADEMQTQHRVSNAERIKAARAAFYAAQGGAQGVMEVEVPNPQLRTQRFIEERYGPEIDRYDQIEDTSVTNRLMIDAITRGSAMVGSGAQ